MSSNTYYRNMLLTPQQLPVMLFWVLYLPAKQCVNSLSAHILRISVSHFSFLEWKTPTFISPGLWIFHPDLNPMNYKSRMEIQQWACLIKKIINVNRPTLWLWETHHHYATDKYVNVSLLSVCSYKKTKDYLSIQFDCRLYICTF